MLVATCANVGQRIVHRTNVGFLLRIPRELDVSPADYAPALQKWFQLRPQVSDQLGGYCWGQEVNAGDFENHGDDTSFDWKKDFGAVLIFPLDHSDPTRDTSQWVVSYHGTNFYALGNVMMFGLLASESEDKGHAILENMPGCYTSPLYLCARGYATPHRMFNTNRWFRVIAECLVNPNKRLRVVSRTPVNKQWIHPERECQVTRIFVDCNAPPDAGDYRFIDWKPELEALTPGITDPPKAVVWLKAGFWGTIDEEKKIRVSLQVRFMKTC